MKMRPKNKMTLDEFKDKHYGAKGTESRDALDNGYENFKLRNTEISTKLL
jgi:hypothetical protein